MKEASSVITSTGGVRLVKGAQAGVCRAQVVNAEERFNLPWDRYMRLKFAADHIRRIVGDAERGAVLDVGGFDGALAYFLPGYEVDVIDPATTSGSGLDLPVGDRSAPIVTSIDAIEHVPPGDRERLLAELARAAGRMCLINFPNPATMPAQKLVYALTGNALVKEHVEYGLPDKREVMAAMESHGFACQAIPSTSLAIWVAQYTLANLAGDAAAQVSRYLVQAHGEEPFTVPLYMLIICERN